jgi:thiosulfate reductase cytochrome b subunit
MTIEATTIKDPGEIGTAAARSGGTIHPVWVRATHWVNALAMLMMIGSGWQIYDASPLFPFTFPTAITLGEMQRVLEWLGGKSVEER